jgi:hypothetical protein
LMRLKLILLSVIMVANIGMFARERKPLIIFCKYF